MADIRAFRAYRYDLGRVGALSDVIAPPYDVIDPALQQTLYDRSPYNVIRLILNKETSADTEADNRYTRSAAVLRDWLRDDVLVQDSARSLYVYHQDFEVEGQHFTRKGFLAIGVATFVPLLVTTVTVAPGWPASCRSSACSSPVWPTALTGP